MNNNTSLNNIKLFTIQNLLLETELIKLEKSGIEIGHLASLKKDEIVDIELFQQELRRSAKKMADFYELYYCMENSVRQLIKEKLATYGTDWWDKKVPQGVKKDVKELQDKEKSTPMSYRSDDPLDYVTFGQLIDIFNANWADFTDVIRSKTSMEQTLSQFNYLRNVIAHSCELNEDEIERFKILIKDWLRIQTYL